MYAFIVHSEWPKFNLWSLFSSPYKANNKSISFSPVPSESFTKEATLFDVMEQNVEQQSKGDVKETKNEKNSNKCSTILC